MKKSLIIFTCLALVLAVADSAMTNVSGMT